MHLTIDKGDVKWLEPVTDEAWKSRPQTKWTPHHGPPELSSWSENSSFGNRSPSKRQSTVTGPIGGNIVERS